MSGDDASVGDFMFGFNDSTFSDRELIIDILDENVARTESGDLHSSENCVGSDPSSSSEGCSKALNFHVSSLLLAKKSPFFHKLFANGMMESKQRCITVRIHASEEKAFVELLKYMYSGTLTASSAPSLLAVLKLADRFEVVSCVRLCVKLLSEIPMSTEFALLYLDSISTTSMTDEVQLLADATKLFLRDRYKDIDKVRDEIMEMPLAGVEVILSSDVLKVYSEDAIFNLVVKWIVTHYPKVEDQRNILSTHLCKYIRFPYLSLDKLREVLSCNILDDGFAYKAVVDALFFKVKTAPHHHYSSKATTVNSAFLNYYRPYVRRDYKRRPVKVLPLPCEGGIIVHFDLNFDECTNLKPKGYLRSDTFSFGGLGFYLYAGCSVNSVGAMAFYVRLSKDKTTLHESFGVCYKFAAWSISSNSFVQKRCGEEDYDHGNAITLYETEWSSFEAGQTLHPSDGYLYFEVKLRRQ